jgi:UDP-N-acetylglucosamine transferase subunit ALG13
MTIVTRSRNQWLVPSTSRVGTAYIVVRNDRGQLVCDCDGTYFRGVCKHQTAVAEKLAAETQIVAVDVAKIAAARAIGMLK